MVILFFILSVSLSACVSVTANKSSFSSPHTESPDNGKVEVKSESITTSYGYQCIVGEVINNTRSNAKFVKITATFYDKDNRVVDTEFSFASDTDQTPLKPSLTAPFKLLISKDTQFDHYKLDVSWQ